MKINFKTIYSKAVELKKTPKIKFWRGGNRFWNDYCFKLTAF